MADEKELETLKSKISDLEAAMAEQKKDIETRDATIQQQSDALKMKDKALLEEAEDKRKAKIISIIDKAKQDGKVIPVFESPLKALLFSTDDKKVVKFSENDKEKELSQLDLAVEVINRLPKLVEFGEDSGSGDGGGAGESDIEMLKREYGVDEAEGESLSDVEIHQEAVKLMGKEKGISYSDALLRVYQETKGKKTT